MTSITKCSLVSNKKLEQIDDRRYKRLTSGLKRIDNSIPPMALLLDFDLVGVADAEDTDLDSFNYMCIHQGLEFKCICGKAPLQKLAILSYQNQKYVMGSTCIQELEKMSALHSTDPYLREKILEWAEKFRDFEKERKCIKCVGCHQPKVRKDYKYKDKRRRLRCKECVKDKSVRCGNCNKWVYHPKTSPKCMYYWQCEKCYASGKNNELLTGKCHLTTSTNTLEFLSDSE